MQNKNLKKDILFTLITSLKLIAICSFIAVLVAFVNYFTKPIIEANENKKTALAVKEMFGENVVSVKAQIPDSAYTKNITQLYLVYDEEENFVSYLVKIAPTGFKGKIDALTAINEDYTVGNLKIVSTNEETAGIGTRVTEDSFLSQFIGQSDIIGKVDAISGATKSSKPLILAVDEAIRFVKDYKGGAFDE